MDSSFYLCDVCNCEVPLCNKVLHSIRCKRINSNSTRATIESQEFVQPSRGSPESLVSAESGPSPNTSNSILQPVVIDMADSDVEDIEMILDDDKSVPQTWSCEVCTFMNPCDASSCGACDALNPLFKNNLLADPVDPDTWNCASCTMRNGKHNRQCSVCGTSRQQHLRQEGDIAGDECDNVREADPVFRGRLIDDIDEYPTNGWGGHDDMEMESIDVPGAMLMGALGGAGLGFVNNRDLLASAMLGAAAGGAGASMLNTLNRQTFRRSNYGGRTSNNSSSSSSGNSTSRRNYANASQRATYSSQTRGYLHPGFPVSPFSNAEIFQQFGPIGGLLPVDHVFAQMMNQRRGMADVDGMSYESLLERFVSPPRPTDEGVLQSLPTRIIKKTHDSNATIDLSGDEPCPGSLPRSSKGENETCNICLGEFEDGDNVKTLPCLHQFHCSCIDKWLRQSTTCPVCKFSLR